MAEEVELIALRPRLLSLPQRSGELIAEVIDKEHVVFPPVSHASRPLNLQIYWLGETRKNLTLAVGMDGTDVMVMRLYRGHVNAHEIRERALRSDRANNFVELMPD
ncbi:hypothetical protein AAVH_36705 [Aphelenchoides avenae]|nr:hypothetical protein AAVH_36705 [Aphelenchus avenae]